MKQETLPQNKEELKEFILETIREANGDFIPDLSDDEQEELDKLHGESLNRPINKEDFVPL